VLANFGAMTERLLHAAQEFRGEGEAIKDEVMESMVQLQFQDRVGQILSHVVKSIGQVDASADRGDSLREMAQSYTTEEQRRIHDGVAAIAVTPQAVDFF
jgi:methyl-accepting chemotaxis protein